MIPAVVPGLLLLLALELLALAAVGYVVARVAMRQTDDLVALGQGLVIGQALWGLIVNFALHVLPGRAGALLGWMALLALAAALTWRAPHPVRPRPRTALAFAGATLVVLWCMLAARQLLNITDAATHLGLSAFIQEGGWPPILSFNPDQPLLYHYGIDLLIGLLAPPIGPGLPFTTELLGAHAWTGFALVVVTLLRRRGGWVSVPVLAAAAHARCLDPGRLHHRSTRHPAGPRPDRFAGGRPSRLTGRRVLARRFSALADRIRSVATKHLETPVRRGL